MAYAGLLNVSRSSRLSDLEDEKVVEFAKSGCSHATEYLVSKYRGFVECKARSYFVAGAEQDDVVQEGMIGLYKAIRDFRCDRNARFRAFVELCVTRQIITAVKSARRNKHSLLNDCCSLDGAVNGDDGGCLMDLVADSRVHDPEQILIERRTLESLRDSVSEELSGLECEVLRRYLRGTSYSDMARDLRRPAKAIDNALQRAKRKVGRRLVELN